MALIDMPEDLAAAVETAAGVPVESALLVAQEGDIGWYVIQLADGRWAAADEAEIAPDRVAIFASRDEAVAYQREGWLISHPEALERQASRPRFRWPWRRRTLDEEETN